MTYIQDKQQAWIKKLIDLENVVDGVGQGLDSRVKETVATLNLLGFPTYQSCEGHLDSGYPYPWIMVEADGEPEEMFEGEKILCQEIAKKFQTTCEDIKKGRHGLARAEFDTERSKKPLTTEFKTWTEKNHALYNRLQEIIDEFNQLPSNHEVRFGFKLEKVFASDTILLHNANTDYGKSYWGKDDPDAPPDLADHLHQKQAELKKLTEFLKQKYFENEI